MDFLEIDGVRLETAWHGPPPDRVPTLVFLHEGLGCVSLWRDFPARLAQATGLGALVYSRRGYGLSDPVALPRPVRFMHDEALVLEQVLEAAGVRDAIVVGHSDGASIALIHAATHVAPPRTRVRALALEAPHVFVEEITVASIAAIGRDYETTELPRRLAKHHGANTACAFRGWHDVWLDPEFRSWSIAQLLPRVAAPALVLQGADDEYGTMRQVAALLGAPGGPSADISGGTAGPVTARLLAGCGHSPHRDRPDEVLAAMRAFIAAVLR